MSMMIELWGEESVNFSLEEIKQKIRELPPIWSERKTYILHEWSNITGIQLKHSDYTDVGALPQRKDEIE